MNKTVVFDNSYARLSERFYTRQNPVPVSAPSLIRVNEPLAQELGIDPAWLASDEGVQILAGNQNFPGSDPIATVYAGHQFGSWNPQLGDGRALLLGEVLTRNGDRYDIQLKGSGPTPYSRGGDGRSPVGPVLREYIVSEAMFALGVPTTRSLAAVSTGELVRREDILPGGVLARVARSHLRIGTVQYFASQGDLESLHTLVNYVNQRHYPEAAEADNPALALLDSVIAKQADLVARWQLIGFIHGVMNTDNILLSGETIDYGPCAFMDSFHPETVYSSIDRAGRYAYCNQPSILHWNLVRLAEALLPLIHTDKTKAIERVQESIGRFQSLFEDARLQGLRKKVGFSDNLPEDETLIQDLFKLMAELKADFTLTFRRLSELAGTDEAGAAPASISDIFEIPDAMKPWLRQWRKRIETDPQSTLQRQQSMLSINPAYIPRNHMIEDAIDAVTYDDNLAPFHKLVDVLAKPYEYNPAHARHATPPKPEEVVKQTFCGT